LGQAQVETLPRSAAADLNGSKNKELGRFVSTKRSKYVDFNTVLMGFNFVVACLIISGFSYAKDNDYVDQQTMWLGLLLSLQTHIALQMERKRRDPFVVLLVFTTIFYFSFRIFTLAVYPFSTSFMRYAYGPQNSNYALVFILVANCFLYAGFRSVQFNSNKLIDADNWKPKAPARIIALMIVSIIYSYFSGIYWTPEDEPRIVSLVSIFVSPSVILLMSLAYFILFRKSLGKKAAGTIGALIILEIVAHTLAGSRSGITTLFQNAMIALLAISSCIKFRRGYFILGCALAPAVLLLLVGTFTISTYNRAHKDPTSSVGLGDASALIGDAVSEMGENSELEILLPPIFNRAGFFDYSAETIANSDRYKEVFNLTTYAKSIIDNLLTPGFDVYDQPKISNALQFIYNDLGTPSKEMVTESYQSDQFGIYGEYYALFKYASLPLFFLTAFLLKRTYVRLRRDNPFGLAMMRVVVLSVFVKIVDSYGLDWTIIETVPLAAAILLYSFFFRSSRTSPGAIQRRSLPLSAGGTVFE
jgi:hypothetical protein